MNEGIRIIDLKDRCQEIINDIRNESDEDFLREITKVRADLGNLTPEEIGAHIDMMKIIQKYKVN